MNKLKPKTLTEPYINWEPPEKNPSRTNRPQPQYSKEYKHTNTHTSHSYLAEFSRKNPTLYISSSPKSHFNALNLEFVYLCGVSALCPPDGCLCGCQVNRAPL